MKNNIRIGCASGFWGDSSCGPWQLANAEPKLDYLVFDYLAETTMAILVKAKAKDSNLGYATDFVEVAMRDNLPILMANRVKIISNAGGVNPKSCAKALHDLADSLGLHPKIAIVEGDDILGLMPQYIQEGICDMYNQEAIPKKLLSANAYLGAWPIVRALESGADIVITGRCVDSAVTLAPCIYEFAWKAHEYDKLSSGSLAGHLIECACQATGGLFTDWQMVENWQGIGYPIVECSETGEFYLTKLPNTGGLIHWACVAEQMLYEIGDPANYVLPDVVANWKYVKIQQVSDESVLVCDARGQAPTQTFKVCATQMIGYQCTGTLVIIGDQALQKAKKSAQAIIHRVASILERRHIPMFTSIAYNYFGAETLYGEHAKTSHSREVMMRLTVVHERKEALEIFAREIAPAGTSWSPGTTGVGGRPAIVPRISPLSFLIPKTDLSICIQVDENAPLPIHTNDEAIANPSIADSRHSLDDSDFIEPITVEKHFIQTPLRNLCWARSGDKGDISNIGLIARDAKFLPYMANQVTAEAVKSYFSHLVHGTVERYFLPGINAFNFVMNNALEGGGPTSSRIDPLGKGMAQMLLDLEILVPPSLLP
ncbi:MAG: DUF1446 domain-containing protein [Gammaproteobacteria bacterium]|nr:DUF1446 domain-containing protein [Gammaproteobacteria bacterium]